MPATVHKQARTPPVIRAGLHASREPGTVLARHYSLTVAAIDRTSRWVYVEIPPDRTAASASGFLERLIQAAPFRLTSRVLTDHGKEFTDRFCATGERRPTGAHAFDWLTRRRAQTLVSAAAGVVSSPATGSGGT